MTSRSGRTQAISRASPSSWERRSPTGSSSPATISSAPILSWYCGASFGFRIPIESFFIDVDAALLARYRTSQDALATPFKSALVPQLRLKAGSSSSGIRPVAGVSLEAFIPGPLYDPALMSAPLIAIPTGDPSRPVNVVPRCFSG